MAGIQAMGPADERILTWFFGRGLVEFERSTFGVQLERAEQFSLPSEPCGTCVGSGWVKVRVSVCSKCRGQGKVTTRNAGRPRMYGVHDDCGVAFATVPGELVDCPDCRGARIVESPAESFRGGYVVEEVCPTCQGRRVDGAKRAPVVLNSAQAAHISGQAFQPPQEPDGLSLRMYGLVLRRLPCISERDVCVLYAYYGVGDAWRKETKLGQLQPVIALTTAGQVLLKRYRKKRPKELRAALSEQKNWDTLTQPERLRELAGMPERLIAESVWAEAKAQAEALVDAAKMAWIASGLKTGEIWRETRRTGKKKRNPKPEPRLEPIDVKLMRVQRYIREVIAA